MSGRHSPETPPTLSLDTLSISKLLAWVGFCEGMVERANHCECEKLRIKWGALLDQAAAELDSRGEP